MPNSILSVSSRFAVEIWQRIFRHACLDDGLTGISLSGVSRHIRLVSATTKLQSVRVTGLRQLQSFLHVIENTPEEERHVRFLLIEDDMSDIGELPLASDDGNDSWFTRYYEHRAARQVTGPEGWYTIYSAVITLVAPFLEVFSLHVPDNTQDKVFPHGIVLPALRDLSFGRVGIPHQLPLMPLLRRLHVYGRLAPGDMLLCFKSLPELDCIRFSDADEHELADTLDPYLGRPQSVELSEPKTFGNLRMLIIKLVKPAPSFCGNGYMHWSYGLRKLQRLSWKHPRGTDRPSVVVLSPGPYCYSQDLAVQDWRNVVGMGGDGSWDISQEGTDVLSCSPSSSFDGMDF